MLSLDRIIGLKLYIEKNLFVSMFEIILDLYILFICFIYLFILFFIYLFYLFFNFLILAKKILLLLFFC